MGSRGPLTNPQSIRGMKAGLSRRSLADIPADELGTATMPRWLSKDAKAFWRRNAPELERRGVLTGLDEDMFAVLCEEWSRLRELDRILARDGHVITGPRGGTRLHPLIGVRNRAERAVLEGMEAFGMTPRSRARIHVTPPRPVKLVDPMDTLLDRPRSTDDPRAVLRGDSPASENRR